MPLLSVCVVLLHRLPLPVELLFLSLFLLLLPLAFVPFLLGLCVGGNEVLELGEVVVDCL